MIARKTIDKLKEAFIERIFSYDECLIDSLIRIDENIYKCDNCILADTVNTVSTVREGMADKSICPVIMKEEVNDVIR